MQTATATAVRGNKFRANMWGPTTLCSMLMASGIQVAFSTDCYGELYSENFPCVRQPCWFNSTRICYPRSCYRLHQSVALVRWVLRQRMTLGRPRVQLLRPTS